MSAHFNGADFTPDAVEFGQTAGELLNFHPHVHVLVTDGGFTPDETFRPLAWFDSQQVERWWSGGDRLLIAQADLEHLYGKESPVTAFGPPTRGARDLPSVELDQTERTLLDVGGGCQGRGPLNLHQVTPCQ